MRKRLQQVLKKYMAEELNINIIKNVHQTLQEALEDVTVLSKEDIELLISFQDEDGGFKLTHFTGFRAEMAQDCYYYPSYLFTLILINVSLKTDIKVDEIIIKKALNFCVSNNFNGHGYEAFETQLDTAILFVKNNFKIYSKDHKSICKNVIDLLDNLLITYEKMIKENKTYGYWGIELKEKMNKFIDLYDDSIYYAAYGSNLNIEQMKRRCPGARVVGSSFINGYKLKFNLYLTIEKCINSNVPLGIWKITKDNEFSLDRYEGFPYVYRKEYFTVEVDGIKRNCIIYIMNDIPERKDVPPTKEYIERCKKGYKDFGFNANELNYNLTQQTDLHE